MNILQFVKCSRENPAFALPEDVIERPSRVIGKDSNILSGSSQIYSWKNELPPQLIDDSQRILQYFGLDFLYDDTTMPCMGVIRNIHGSKSGSRSA